MHCMLYNKHRKERHLQHEKTVWKIEVDEPGLQMKPKGSPFNFILAIFIPGFSHRSLATGAECFAMPLELLLYLAPCEPAVCKVCLVHNTHQQQLIHVER